MFEYSINMENLYFKAPHRGYIESWRYKREMTRKSFLRAISK